MTNFNSQHVNHPPAGIVTQIAAMNLVKGKITFAKVRVISSGSVFFFSLSLPSAPEALFWLLTDSAALLLRIEAMCLTKRRGFVVMISRYHSFVLTCADTFDCMQTNTASEHNRRHKGTFICSRPIMVVLLLSELLVAHAWDKKRSFWS